MSSFNQRRPSSPVDAARLAAADDDHQIRFNRRLLRLRKQRRPGLRMLMSWAVAVVAAAGAARGQTTNAKPANTPNPPPASLPAPVQPALRGSDQPKHSALATSNDPDPKKAPRKTGEDIALSAEEWSRLEAFMQANSPKKWGMYVSLPDKDIKQNLKNGISQRFKSLERIRATDEKHFEIELRAIRIEDQIYGCLQEIKSERQVEENQKKLWSFCDELVTNRDEWKLERLRRVHQELRSMNLDTAAQSVNDEIAQDRKVRTGRSQGAGRQAGQGIHQTHGHATQSADDGRKCRDVGRAD